MRTKFYSYTNELNEIVGILNNFPKIHDISSQELQKYEKIISRKEFLQKKINILLNKRANIIGKYNDKNRLWLSTNMNCRKYCKLEQSAAYSRDSALYKIGFLDKKPISPIIYKLKNTITDNLYTPLHDKLSIFTAKANSYLKSMAKKSPTIQTIENGKKFLKNELPTSLANLAISGTKKCIISYRSVSNRFTRNISTAKPIRTLSFIVEKAREEIDLEQNPFLSRIKVNPYTFEYCNNNAAEKGYYGTGRIKVQTGASQNMKHTLNPNFDLVI